METEKLEVSNYQKLCIFINWSLKACGLAFLLSCWAVWKGYPTPFRSVEAVEVYAQLDDLAHATMAAQEDILELHKKVKK
jgi:hypothetical protein